MNRTEIRVGRNEHHLGNGLGSLPDGGAVAGVGIGSVAAGTHRIDVTELAVSLGVPTMTSMILPPYKPL